MAYDQSLVAITPAAFKATAEALGQAMGHTGNEFTVPLSAGGAEPATHYGLHAWATPEAAAVWLGNAYPPDTGYTEQQIDDIRNALTISVQENANPGEHFDTVLTSQSLQRIQE